MREGYKPEIGKVTEQTREVERFPDVRPGLQEITPTKNPNKEQPLINDIIGQMEEEDEKEKRRQEKIDEIIKNRNNPKTIH